MHKIRVIENAYLPSTISNLGFFRASQRQYENPSDWNMFSPFGVSQRFCEQPTSLKKSYAEEIDSTDQRLIFSSQNNRVAKQLKATDQEGPKRFSLFHFSAFTSLQDAHQQWCCCHRVQKPILGNAQKLQCFLSWFLRCYRLAFWLELENLTSLELVLSFCEFHNNKIEFDEVGNISKTRKMQRSSFCMLKKTSDYSEPGGSGCKGMSHQTYAYVAKLYFVMGKRVSKIVLLAQHHSWLQIST